MLQCSVRLKFSNVCIVAKWCVLPKNCLKKQIGIGLWEIKWSRDRRRYVTQKIKVVIW